MCGRLGDGGRRDEHPRDLPQADRVGTAPAWLMNEQGVVRAANVGVDPGAAWHFIPQHHDLLMQRLDRLAQTKTPPCGGVSVSCLDVEDYAGILSSASFGSRST
jgi:hypothetical protein